MAQVEFTLPAVARKGQGQKGREDPKGKDVVTCGTDCRRLGAGRRKLLDFLGKAV